MKLLRVLMAPIVFGACLSVVACNQKQNQTPDQPPPPPPKTAAEISQQMRAAVEQAMNDAPPGRPTEAGRNDIRNKVRGEMSKLGSEPNKDDGFADAAQSVIEQMKSAENGEQWARVVYLADAAQTLDANARVAGSLERAMFQINKPVVTITGFTQIEDVTTVHLSVFLPEANRTEKVNVREGEEFNDLRFLEIIGRNQGIRLEYLKDNSVFEVYGP